MTKALPDAISVASGAAGIGVFLAVTRAHRDSTGLLRAPDGGALLMILALALFAVLAWSVAGARMRQLIAWAALPLCLLGARGLERIDLIGHTAALGTALAGVMLASAFGLRWWLESRAGGATVPPRSMTFIAALIAAVTAYAGTVASGVYPHAFANLARRAENTGEPGRPAWSFAAGVVLRETMIIPERRPLLRVLARVACAQPAASPWLSIRVTQGTQRVHLRVALAGTLPTGVTSLGDGWVETTFELPDLVPGAARVEAELGGGGNLWQLGRFGILEGTAGGLRALDPLPPSQRSRSGIVCRDSATECAVVASGSELREAVLVDLPASREWSFVPDELTPPVAAGVGTLIVPIAIAEPTWVGPVRVHVRLTGATVSASKLVLDAPRRPWTRLALELPRPAADGMVRLSIEGADALDANFGRGGVLAVGEPALIRDVPATRSVVLVSLDTVRADRVGAWGYFRPTTPVLDALAARGTRFLHATAIAPWTLPSHASVFTSESAGELGEFPVPRSWSACFDSAEPLLAERLADRGFETVAFTGGGAVGRRTGLMRGFESVFEAPDRADDPALSLANVERWMATRRGGPFFLFFHTYRAHDPYVGPRFRSELRSGMSRSEQLSLEYDGGVWEADRALGRLLDLLTSSGLLKDTLVVVMSDHGEEFDDRLGETTGQGHGQSLYPEILHVPLVVAGPGVGAGQSVTSRVTLLDVAPTVLAWVGAPAGKAYQGQDLLGLSRRIKSVPLDQYPFEGVDRRGTLLGAMKVVVSDAGADLDGGLRVYDLDDDPDERRPLVLADCPAALALALESRARLGRAQPAFDPIRSPELREQLRALGYIN